MCRFSHIMWLPYRAVELQRLGHVVQAHVGGGQHGVELHVDGQVGRGALDQRVVVRGVGQQVHQEHRRLEHRHGRRTRQRRWIAEVVGAGPARGSDAVGRRLHARSPKTTTPAQHETTIKKIRGPGPAATSRCSNPARIFTSPYPSSSTDLQDLWPDGRVEGQVALPRVIRVHQPAACVTVRVQVHVIVVDRLEHLASSVGKWQRANQVRIESFRNSSRNPRAQEDVPR